MNTDILIRVRLSAKQFRSYCAFDTFRLRRRHLPALIITAILSTLGIAALLFGRNVSGTIAGLLIGLALAVPMIVFGLYTIQIETQVSQQGLKNAPEVYALRMNPDSVTVSGLHRSAGSTALTWYQLWAAYRVRDAIYLYASETRAFILPAGQANVSDEKLWSFLCTYMGSEKCFDTKEAL